jgi:predicted nucleotidyltransferase
VSLLGRVSAALQATGIPYALVGASALTVYGVNRSTLDVDLFATAPACLDRRTWDSLGDEGIGIEVRKGDFDDPLAGVVRFTASGDSPVDLVIGRSAWQGKLIARAETAHFAGVELPVLTVVDLILLKLYAGGPQDAWDIQQLLVGAERDSLIAGVERELSELPRRSSVLWRRIVEAGA